MLSISQKSDTLTVRLQGEIDHCAAKPMREAIENALAENAVKTLCLDFAEVTFMDSSGVGMLIGRYKSMAARGGKTCAVHLNPEIRRLFCMAGLHRIITIIETEEKDA